MHLSNVRHETNNISKQTVSRPYIYTLAILRDYSSNTDVIDTTTVKNQLFSHLRALAFVCFSFFFLATCAR